MENIGYRGNFSKRAVGKLFTRNILQ